MSLLTSRKINRDLVALAVSTILLSFSFVLFSDLFLFSKFVTVPQWVNNLQKPFRYFDFPGFTNSFTFTCLLPSVFILRGKYDSFKIILKTVLMSPLIVVAVYSIKIINVMTDPRDILNIPFQYFWIIIFNCTIPIIAVFILLLVYNELKEILTKKSN
jgi:hypothetical protein